MDGNGRWAQARGLPRLAGHRQGVEAICRIVRAAPGLAISDLSLYAFSSDNWRRPPEECAGILAMIAEFATEDAPELVAQGVRLSFVGRRDRLPRMVAAAMLGAEVATVTGRRMHLRVAVDYSSRESLLEAAHARPRTCEDIDRSLACPSVDLLVRTGGEQRLSDFLLWECAYAELVFVSKLWPDFAAADLASAVAEFQARSRRFGAVPAWLLRLGLLQPLRACPEEADIVSVRIVEMGMLPAPRHLGGRLGEFCAALHQPLAERREVRRLKVQPHAAGLQRLAALKEMDGDRSRASTFMP
ncbi:MAG: di-trans,poly-cis-decaprenylcistransferase [Acidobacteria bacterium]|nr:di-trans,poly-cis-decaprenylcistransferase [Acidobacteriota bacterium]